MSHRPVEKPTRGPARSHAHRDEPNAFTETHPAYACLEVSRIDGTFGPMFGSALPNHHGTVEFRVKMADRTHNLGMDWIYAKGPQLISWRMTHAQFVEIMAQMNRSGGVPITLLDRYDHATDTHVVYPEIEWIEGTDGTEAGEALKTVEANGKQIAREIEAINARVMAILAAAGVTKKVQTKVSEELDQLPRAVRGMKFFLDQVQEAGSKVVAAARTEVDAAVSTAVRRLGFERLDEIAAATQARLGTAAPKEEG